jgi:hypothetical protein
MSVPIEMSVHFDDSKASVVVDQARDSHPPRGTVNGPLRRSVIVRGGTTHGATFADARSEEPPEISSPA